MSDAANPDELRAVPLFVGDTEFRLAPLGGWASGEHLVIVKPEQALEEYRELVRRHDRPRMVELGIAYGGSVGFLSLVAQPERFVAIELSAERVALLDDFINDRGLGDRVRLFYGVNQADRARIGEIVSSEFPDGQVDLVIDDASHLYEQSLASFETLFPYVRPGGDYVIEDWTGDHSIRALLAAVLADEDSPYHPWAAATMDGQVESGHAGQLGASDVARDALIDAADARPPLSRLVAQVALGPAEAGSGVASVTVNDFWAVVRRNDVELEPGSYRLRTACPDHFGTFS